MALAKSLCQQIKLFLQPPYSVVYKTRIVILFEYIIITPPPKQQKFVNSNLLDATDTAATCVFHSLRYSNYDVIARKGEKRVILNTVSMYRSSSLSLPFLCCSNCVSDLNNTLFCLDLFNCRPI